MSFTSATFDHPELRDAEVLVTAGRSLDSCVHFTDEVEVKGSVFSNCGLSQLCSSGGGGYFPYLWHLLIQKYSHINHTHDETVEERQSTQLKPL